MNKVIKLVTVVVAGLLVANCSATYKMKSEKGKVLNQVPKWYMNDFSERKRVIRLLLVKTKIKCVSLVLVQQYRQTYLLQ
jgi:hypothetical protein